MDGLVSGGLKAGGGLKSGILRYLKRKGAYACVPLHFKVFVRHPRANRHFNTNLLVGQV